MQKKCKKNVTIQLECSVVKGGKSPIFTILAPRPHLKDSLKDAFGIKYLIKCSNLNHSASLVNKKCTLLPERKYKYFPSVENK